MTIIIIYKTITLLHEYVRNVAVCRQYSIDVYILLVFLVVVGSCYMKEYAPVADLAIFISYIYIRMVISDHIIPFDVHSDISLMEIALFQVIFYSVRYTHFMCLNCRRKFLYNLA